MTNAGKGSLRRGGNDAESKYRKNYDSIQWPVDIGTKAAIGGVTYTVTRSYKWSNKLGKMIDLTVKRIKRKNKRGAK